jgi:hypothetical protein
MNTSANQKVVNLVNEFSRHCFYIIAIIIEHNIIAFINAYKINLIQKSKLFDWKLKF